MGCLLLTFMDECYTKSRECMLHSAWKNSFNKGSKQRVKKFLGKSLDVEISYVEATKTSFAHVLWVVDECIINGCGSFIFLSLLDHWIFYDTLRCDSFCVLVFEGNQRQAPKNDETINILHEDRKMSLINIPSLQHCQRSTSSKFPRPKNIIDSWSFYW